PTGGPNLRRRREATGSKGGPAGGRSTGKGRRKGLAMGARALVPWDELASRVDIVEVVSGHVQLRRAGKDWVGLCPFHVEKTPSFTVSPDKQFFYCFGCQAGGDVYNFLMRVRGLDFREAAEEVARRAGVDLAAYGYNEGERQVWETRRRVLAACQ